MSRKNLVRKGIRALVAPVRWIGHSLVGLGVAGVGSDVLHNGKVPVVTIVALLVVGGLLWALANLAAEETK